MSTPSTRGSTRLESCEYRWVITHGAVPSPPCESKRSSLRVSTPSTPPRESTECDPSKSTPDRSPVRPERPIPSGHSDAHSADATAFTSSLRFRAARSPAAANGTGTTADAAPGTPPAHAGTPSTLPGTVPRGISVGIPCDVGTRPGLGCIATRQGETVPRALGVLGREGTLRTLAVLRDLMQVLTVPRVLRVPNVRTTDRGVGRQL